METRRSEAKRASLSRNGEKQIVTVAGKGDQRGDGRRKKFGSMMRGGRGPK